MVVFAVVLRGIMVSYIEQQTVAHIIKSKHSRTNILLVETLYLNIVSRLWSKSEGIR